MLKNVSQGLTRVKERERKAKVWLIDNWNGSIPKQDWLGPGTSIYFSFMHGWLSGESKRRRGRARRETPSRSPAYAPGSSGRWSMFILILFQRIVQNNWFLPSSLLLLVVGPTLEFGCIYMPMKGWIGHRHTHNSNPFFVLSSMSPVN